MRGDYIRDLYAKTLALVGLGVLAVSGALLDYWPGVTVPVPSRPAPQIASASISAVQPESTSSTVGNAVQRRSSLSSGRSASMSGVTFTSLSAATPAGPIGTSVSLVSEPFVVSSETQPLAFRPGDRTTPPAMTESEFGLAASSSVEAARPVPQAQAEVFAAADDDSGVVTLAFRKTGSSIAKTGAKAGSSIVGAVRGISGAFRKALPAI